MKNNSKFYKSLPIIGLLLVGLGSCTKLDETLYNSKSQATLSNGVGIPGPLSGVYGGLNGLIQQGNWYAMEEHSSDEMLGPTRGTDWDDFGTWRKLHLHTWDGSHNQINDTWNSLNGSLYQATLVAETATGQTKAEAQFLRAFFMYIICDLYGQVPYVPATALTTDPGTVLTRSAAVDFMITDLDAAISVLPRYTLAARNKATKEAAQFLEARVYLNKAVYKQNPASAAGPYTFDAGDMSKVITLCNAIAANSAFSVSNNYWDNFKWNNGAVSTENIFVRENADGINVQFLTRMGNHYNMAPSGWNGFTTLADFYNSFDTADVRRGKPLAGFTDLVGINPGFLVGQIKGPSGGHVGNPIVNLTDRSGNPLIFTPDVTAFYNTESKGIRTVKYPLDPSTLNSDPGTSKNDFVFFRFSDARLMKAEALLRGGTDPNSETAVSIVNGIRTKRGVAALSSLNLTDLLAERGRELYLEAVRRTDLIRFGAFNAPNNARSATSAAYRCVYPIPTIAVSSNPNLKQNVGY